MFVRLVSAEEVARIERAASALGVADPIVEGRLRHDDGVCAFLEADDRCGIHRAFGAEVKPAVCQQYPFALVQTEGGPRAGVDPGCLRASSTWRGGPTVPAAAAMANRVDLTPDEAGRERALLDWAGRADATVGGLGGPGRVRGDPGAHLG